MIIKFNRCQVERIYWLPEQKQEQKLSNKWNPEHFFLNQERLIVSWKIRKIQNILCIWGCACMNTLCVQHNNNKYEEKQTFHQLKLIFMPFHKVCCHMSVIYVYLCNKKCSTFLQKVCLGICLNLHLHVFHPSWREFEINCKTLFDASFEGKKTLLCFLLINIAHFLALHAYTRTILQIQTLSCLQGIFFRKKKRSKMILSF